MIDRRWHPGIGDPTLIGWVTVVAYGFAFLFCAAVVRREPIGVGHRFWYIVSILMLCLGINKQLDLQTWFTEFGRDTAMSQGWYAYRRVAQIVFIAGLLLLSLSCAVGMLRWARLADRYAVRAAVGVALLLAFVLMRATSFHHIDAVLGLEVAESVTFNAALELSGVCLVGWAACGRLWDVGPKRR